MVNITKEEAEWLNNLIDENVYEYNDMTDLLRAKMGLISGEYRWIEMAEWVKKRVPYLKKFSDK